jgi:hypothetical protein
MRVWFLHFEVQDVELEVGQVKVLHKLITVEIGTEARLRQLQHGLPSPVLIGRAQAPSPPCSQKSHLRSNLI